MKRYLLSLSALLCCTLMWAAGGISISQKTIGNGLESQSLNVLSKDRLGRLWVGSDVGLSLISNGTVTNIRDVVTEGGLVILGNVKSIVCTNTVLMASDDRILHYDHKNEYARTVSYHDIILNTQDILLEGNVATFYNKDTRSLYSYDMETRECTLVSALKGSEDYSFCRILRSESDSTILYLADDALGLYSFDRRDGTLRRVPGTDAPINAKATAIDNTNVIWLSVPSKGVKGYHISSNYELIAQYNTQNCNLISNDISYITSLPSGGLLTCHSELGVNVIERGNLVNGKPGITYIPNLKNIESTLVNSQEQETLYATSGFGLISMKKTFIDQLFYLHEQGDGIISYENYISAFEEPDGTVLLGTQDNGICRINPITNLKNIFLNSRRYTVSSMCRFDDDNVLMSDPDYGLLLFNRKTGAIKSLSDDPVLGEISNSGSRNIRLASVPTGDIFIFNVNSRHYVYRQESGTLQEFIIPGHDVQSIKNIENICISQYAVYATCQGEIMEIDYNTTETRNIYHNHETAIHKITSLATNSQGELFFTEPEGLHRYDPRSNIDELVFKTWGNGRFMNVAVDKKDRVWFNTTNEYIHLYDPAKKEMLMYSVEDGVPSSRSLTQFAVCTSTGIVLFPNANGLVAINTNRELMNDTPPVQVICISAKTEKREFSETEIANSLRRPIKLPTKFREFTLEFSANAFNPTYPHLLLYDICKDGTPVMSINTTNSEITIPKIESGTYSLVIRQAYRKGLSEPETLLRFKIPKPFLATIPGVLISLILFLVFGYSIARISSRVEKNRMDKALAAQDIKNREDKIAFLSNIAHELRTPLSLIYNPVKDFLQEKSVDGIDYERMERIFNQVNKMTVMVNMILDSSRADINKADILIEEVNLNEWINFLLEDYRIDCYGKGFSLRFIMDNSIGNVSIDKRIIETGLSNMVNNAIKYSPTGTTITVSTSRVGDMIRVSVKDQGRGFSSDPENLFKRYYRENEDSSIPGYGLGLPYARLQLSLISGNMSAYNNEDGVGSTFYMEFPPVIGKNGAPVKQDNTQTDTQPENSTESLNQSDSQEGMAQDFDTTEMTILYAGGKESELESFMDQFKSQFRLIITATDGIDALSKLRDTRVDLIISNADMPKMDGFELCRTIKSTLDISHIPVILLTSRADKRNKGMGYKMGADAFIVKPYDNKQMSAMILSQLGGRFEIKRQYNYGYFSKMSPDQTFSLTDEEFVRSLNEFIDANISNRKLTDRIISEKMGISQAVILRKMQGLLDTNLSHYLLRIRVAMVQDKLKNTDLEPEEIASETGFSSVDDMSKTFKRETGKTISSIRN
ncbi:MAG: response regulator [Bacteroidaceae bacterium]|nr:response regulator [Bacteroidaceae bacterium]